MTKVTRRMLLTKATMNSKTVIQNSKPTAQLNDRSIAKAMAAGKPRTPLDELQYRLEHPTAPQVYLSTQKFPRRTELTTEIHYNGEKFGNRVMFKSIQDAREAGHLLQSAVATLFKKEVEADREFVANYQAELLKLTDMKEKK